MKMGTEIRNFKFEHFVKSTTYDSLMVTLIWPVFYFQKVVS